MLHRTIELIHRSLLLVLRMLTCSVKASNLVVAVCNHAWCVVQVDTSLQNRILQQKHG